MAIKSQILVKEERWPKGYDYQGFNRSPIVTSRLIMRADVNPYCRVPACESRVSPQLLLAQNIARDTRIIYLTNTQILIRRNETPILYPQILMRIRL